MTRRECELLLSEFFARLGKTDFSLADGTAIKANIGEAVLGFVFNDAEQILICEALIYRFRRFPRSELLAALKQTAANEAETGGGKLNFDSVTLTLSLIRQYSQNIDSAKFFAQMQNLAAASLLWSGTILDRVADKISENNS